MALKISVRKLLTCFMLLGVSISAASEASSTCVIQNMGQDTLIFNQVGNKVRVDLPTDASFMFEGDAIQEQSSTIDTKKITKCVINKDAWSRGFYVNVKQTDMHSISLKAFNYRGEAIKSYDDYFKTDPARSLFKANYVRGVEKLEVYFKNTGEITNDELQISQEFWYMSGITGAFIGACAGFYVVYVTFKMARAGWCLQKCERREQDFSSKEKLTGCKKFKDCVIDLIEVIPHNADLISDILYVCTVPTFSGWIDAMLIVGILQPIGIMAVTAFINSRKKKSGFKGMLWNFVVLITGSTHLSKKYGLETDMDKIMTKPGESDQIRALLRMAFLLEDGPEFIVQMINSLYVGSSWTWIQVISPILSLKGISDRFILQPKLVSNIKLTNYREKLCLYNFFFLTQACCLLPVLIIFQSILEYNDSRAPWARQFGYVRYNLEGEPHPLITP